MVSEKFPVSEVRAEIEKVIEHTLAGETYQPAKATAWTEEVCNKCLDSVTSMVPEGCKLTAQCTISGRQAALHTTSAARWDPDTDDCCTVRWESDNLVVVATMFGLY
ncbi:unnamed protein product [Chrysoparadoxa australica]